MTREAQEFAVEVLVQPEELLDVAFGLGVPLARQDVTQAGNSRSINGYPFLGQVPGLGYGASVHNKNVSEDELLIVITPHILRLADQAPFAMELPPAH